MVKNFQKPAAGLCSYSMWTIADSTGKNTCLAILCHSHITAQEKNSVRPDAIYEDQLEQMLDMTLRQHSDIAHIRAVYVPPIDLQHYGEVDHLAPAGAMEEFVHHVQEQSIAEARDAFASLQNYVHRHELNMDISIALSLKKAKALLQSLGAQATE